MPDFDDEYDKTLKDAIRRCDLKLIWRYAREAWAKVKNAGSTKEATDEFFEDNPLGDIKWYKDAVYSSFEEKSDSEKSDRVGN